MRILLSFILFLSTVTAFAQQKAVSGFVVDRDTKLRLAKVYIYNSSIDEGFYNNTKGEFAAPVKLGDTLFAALSGHAMDTVVYRGQSAIVFQLRSLGIRLKEVNIYGKAKTPQELYKSKLEEYKQKLDQGSSKDLLNLGQRGVGLGIDAIYNLLSRDGKNARHLQKILEKDYKEQVIDYRYRQDYVMGLIDIKPENVQDFMTQYRPTYQFVLSASEYAFIQFVKNSYASYKRNPAMFRLPTLPKLSINEH
ncbi:hypothetical protein [Pedobacter xixiisoli]|uniref:DUF4369 domain-containing protein n=1 Tax=Pedobacter xixiisoli TaxID=1476464 RepID=A0A286ADE5_9SPHI|nr:hypothetical protein [Pedobacter xixiisoli]SOD19926.1 hypothetical protein SAMN06297358_3633 [Pedobacter xixiisoli]